MESFEELSLPEFLGKNLKQINFMKPTPVQAQAIPPALEGKDVIASAQTGTGKTGAFGIPLLTYLENNKDKTAIIMTPTRELAVQVLEVLRKLSGNHPLGGSVLLIGGANMQAQFMALKRKPRLIIGTPGRIIDHLNRGSLILSAAGFLVLDEADRMLDMGFAPQLEEIRKKLPPTRQTLLFSATFPSDIQRMANSYLKNPVRITIGATTKPVEKIVQEVVYTTESRKFDQLMGELKERQGSILIFARTQIRVDRINDRLKEAGLKVTRIHGGRTQSQRRQAIDQFREGRFLILVATDIAARGLDIHHIAHVINYDLPKNPEDYIHRIGRTARAGAEGNSICLLTPEDRSLWERILRLLGTAKDSVKVKKSAHPGFMAPRSEAPVRVNSFRPEQGHRPEGGAPRHERPAFQGRERQPREHREFREHRGPREHQPRDHREHVPREPRAFEHREREDFSPEGGSRHRHDANEPKQRHPGGRHQRRSEGHQQRLAKADGAAPSNEGLEVPDFEDRQPSFDQIEKHAHHEPKPSANPMETPWGRVGAPKPDNRPFGARQGRGGKPFGDRSDRGFRKDFAPRERSQGGEIDGNSESQNRSRSAFGDRKPFGERKHFSDRKSFGDRKPFGARKSYGSTDSSFGERKPFGDRPRTGGSKPFGKPFGERKSFGDRPFGDRKPFGDRPRTGGFKPFGERKSFGDRPAFGDRKPFGDRKSFGDRPRTGGSKPFGERKSFGDRKPFGERKSFGDRKPFRPAGGSGRPNRFNKPSEPRH